MEVVEHFGNEEKDFNPYLDTSGTDFIFNDAIGRIHFRAGKIAGQLKSGLDVLYKHKLNMSHIESVPLTEVGEYIIYVDISLGKENVAERIKDLERAVDELKLTFKDVVYYQKGVSVMPWFPRRMADLDTFAAKVLHYGAELDADHPGFKDEVYRKRRAEIVAKAREFKTGMKLPHIEYTQQETETWGKVYKKLKDLYPKYACKQHQSVFPLLETHCGYSETHVPQLEDVSQFLQACTGWRLRPVMGLLSSRDFLNGLAFRVFHSTQYLRHDSMPLYTPEPDLCHELLGHVPLFADPAFSEFSQEIGMASLGASDEEITHLASVYWFTVEFGMCRENGELKAYGAGLLSSYGELEYCCTSSEPERVKFDPFVAAITPYPITKYQPKYFVAISFEEATELVRRYASTLSREHEIIYDPYTLSMKVINDKNSIKALANQVKRATSVLQSAINKTF